MRTRHGHGQLQPQLYRRIGPGAGSFLSHGKLPHEAARRGLATAHRRGAGGRLDDRIS